MRLGEVEVGMRRSKRWGFGLTLLAAVLVVVVPFLDCSTCSGSGRITVMGSHPEAMSSTGSPSGRLTDVVCPACDGNSRLALYRRLF